MKIPKLFQFIWAGGIKTLPRANIVVILEWMAANPTMDCWLWIDQKTAPQDFNLIEHYQTEFDKMARHKKLEVNLDKLFIKDIEVEEIADPFIRYEIDRLRPNYGASSDMLRYKILYQYGGAYFDSDIGKGPLSLEASGIFDADYANHVLFVDPNSQNKNAIGNDTFITTPNNPLMTQMLNLIHYNYAAPESTYVLLCDKQGNTVSNISNLNAIQSYDRNADSISLFNGVTTNATVPKSIAVNIFRYLEYNTMATLTSKVNKAWCQFSIEYLRDNHVVIEDKFSNRCPVQMLAYLHDQNTHIKDITVKLTGNEMLLAVIYPFYNRNHSTDNNNNNSSAQLSVRGLDGNYRETRRELGLSWANYPITRCDMNTAITAIIASIRFELEIMKFFRLEDHIHNLAVAANCSINEAISNLLPALYQEDLDFQKAKAVQNTLAYNKITKFYKSVKINPAKYFHFDFSHPTHITGTNGLHILSGIFKVARIKEICEAIKDKKEIKEEQIKELTQILKHGRWFLKNELKKLKKHLNNLPENNLLEHMKALDYYVSNMLNFALERYIALFGQEDAELNAIFRHSFKNYSLKKLDHLAEEFSVLKEQITIIIFALQNDSDQLEINDKSCTII